MISPIPRATLSSSPTYPLPGYIVDGPRGPLDRTAARAENEDGRAMVSYRASEVFGSGGPPVGRPRLPRAAAVLGLVVLFGGLALPLLGFVLADDRAPFCGRAGRCCCADEAAGRDDRTCLRRGCGCKPTGEAVPGAPLRIEAVLPASEPLVTVSPGEARWETACERPLPRADAPPVPPPRRPLPA